MTIENLVGEYSIIGSNQDSDNNEYKGILKLVLKNNLIIAKWLINDEQEQNGIGFFHDNILVINFNYIGNDLKNYKGTVVYKCLTKNILDGFWSEEHGNPLYLGSEQCFKINKTTQILN